MRAPELAESVIVDVSAEQLYRVLGDSGNARKWSVFVHHISATNADKVPDGAVGSQRRCFVNENETGARWDEELVACEPARLRRITIFDAVGFRLSASGLVTEQRYEPLGADRTRLTFTLGFLGPHVGLVEAANFRLAEPYVRSVFRRNLANIKRLAEQGEAYSREHPFVGGVRGLVEGPADQPPR